jgi:DNA polymerase V
MCWSANMPTTCNCIVRTRSRSGLASICLALLWPTRCVRPRFTQYAGSRTTRLIPMSNDTLQLVAAAKRCAMAAWAKIGADRYAFTKVGVMLDDLLLIEDRPKTLFDAPPREPALMTALDAVNQRFGKKSMVLASEGITR